MHLTFLDAILWTVITLVQIYIVMKSNYKTIVFAMYYQLLQSLILICFLKSARSYGFIYYFLSVIESLVMGAISIELASKLIVRLKSDLLKWGPIVIALPVFCILIAFYPSLETKTFMMIAIRTSEVALMMSLALLCFCTAFEDKNSKDGKIAKSYMLLLFLLVICVETQMRLGIYGTEMLNSGMTTRLVRDMWPVAWLIGLSAIAISTKRKTNFDNFKSMTNGV